MSLQSQRWLFPFCFLGETVKKFHHGASPLADNTPFRADSQFLRPLPGCQAELEGPLLVLSWSLPQWFPREAISPVECQHRHVSLWGTPGGLWWMNINTVDSLVLQR